MNLTCRIIRLQKKRDMARIRVVWKVQLSIFDVFVWSKKLESGLNVFFGGHQLSIFGLFF